MMANKREQHTGGRGGIRTHGALAGTPVFKTGALNHSATLPALEFRDLAKPRGAGKGRLPPDCHRSQVTLFSVCASGSKGSFHDLGGTVVCLREKVAINRQGDRRRSVAHASADRQYVEAGGD